ncbi:MAG: hypothetical protein WCB02_30740 [Bradyrhizobium sp.]
MVAVIPGDLGVSGARSTVPPGFRLAHGPSSDAGADRPHPGPGDARAQ